MERRKSGDRSDRNRRGGREVLIEKGEGREDLERKEM